MVQSVTDAKIQWLGHAGFKIVFRHEDTERVIYIDPWIGNPKYPAHLKNEAGEAPMPTDADIILITHGHWDHSNCAVPILKASTKECKIACGYELGLWY
jgi:L-ascorbate metabolism protein UlaG (beta-lactamase superfamily)